MSDIYKIVDKNNNKRAYYEFLFSFFSVFNDKIEREMQKG